jgi:hypothetical protein
MTDSASPASAPSPAAAAAPASTAGEDFEAAKFIVEKLNGFKRERQERVLRWVSETLGLVSPAQPIAPPAPAPAPPPSTPTPPANPQAATDIRSFIETKNPRSDVQFVTAVAYYYRFDAPQDQRRTIIDAELVVEATRLADWDRLVNPPSTLNNAVTRGYMDRQGPGQFSISTVGENLVARAMPSEREDNTRAARGAIKKKGAKKKAAGGAKKKKAANKAAKKS